MPEERKKRRNHPGSWTKSNKKNLSMRRTRVKHKTLVSERPRILNDFDKKNVIGEK